MAQKRFVDIEEGSIEYNPFSKTVYNSGNPTRLFSYYRKNGPAFIWPNGTEYWFTKKAFKVNRKNGPSCISFTGKTNITMR